MSDPYYADATVTIHHGDCLGVLRELPDASVDAVVTDPPYGIEFMGRAWDSFSGDAVSRSWDTRGRTMADAPERDAATPGGRSAARTHIRDNPRCRKCGRTINGRDTAKGFKVCHCPNPDIYAPSTSARKFQDWCEAWATECLRVLKPGGHMLAFGGTRTSHRLACAVEDAGFEIRDSIAWLYGSGFPKSLDVSKAIDRRGGADIGWFGPWLREERRRRGISSNQLATHFPSKTGGETGCVRNWELGFNLPTADQFNTLCRVLDLPFAAITEAEREVTGRHLSGLATGTAGVGGHGEGKDRRDAPATDAARTWQGWGTALKPAHEPIVVARKPLAGTVAANVLAHGTGALNVDGCRVGREDGDRTEYGLSNGAAAGIGYHGLDGRTPYDGSAGRWPANVVLDESQAAALDAQSGEQRDGVAVNRNKDPEAEKPHEVYGGGWMNGDLPDRTYGGQGGASRFFYTAKAASSERVKLDGTAHPTVKPLALMRWLVRLVTPPGGTCLEPFAGSGTTVEACILEGFACIAIEREADYLPLIRQRIHRRRDPVEAVRGSGEDAGLFDLLGEEGA